MQRVDNLLAKTQWALLYRQICNRSITYWKICSGSITYYQRCHGSITYWQRCSGSLIYRQIYGGSVPGDGSSLAGALLSDGLVPVCGSSFICVLISIVELLLTTIYSLA